MPQVSVLIVKYNLELITLAQFYLKIVEGAQKVDSRRIWILKL